MSEPDITEIIDGVTITTVIQSVEITRQGKNGGWRISLPLTKTGTLGNQTFSIPAAPVTYDVADLLYDPAAQALMVGLRDATLRIARGELKPIVVPQENTL